MGIKDVLLAPFYLAVIYALAFMVRNRIQNPEIRKYFIPGLSIKFIGAVATGIIYWFYYGSGDSVYYYMRVQTIRRVFSIDTVLGLRILFEKPDIFDYRLGGFFRAMKAYDASSFIVVKIAYLTSLLSMNSYLVIAFIFSILAFTGLWMFFKMCCRIYPDVQVKYLAIACLFVPSVFFWGSGLFKDTVTMGCTCWIVFCIFKIFMVRERIIPSILILIVCAYLTGVIKSYILLALMPATVLWIVLTYRSRMKPGFLRSAVTPVLLAFSVLAGVVLLNQLGKVFSKFNLENIEQKATDMQRWHTYRVEHGKGGDGSAYNLGHVEFTAVGILQKIPAAINVALFRPYPWEARNPVMMVAALESLIFLYFTVILVFLRPRFAIRQINSSPFLIFCLVFSFIFAFSVGFTSYNFGALVRYKIPCLPFYAVILAVLYSRYKESKEQKKPQDSEVVQQLS